MKQSSQSIGEESPANLPAAHVGSLVKVETPSIVDGQIATLQAQLVESHDQRKEERFLWFAACGLLFLVLSFMAAGAAAGTIVSIIYVALLLVLSKRWGFEGLWEALHEARRLIKSEKRDDEGDEG